MCVCSCPFTGGGFGCKGSTWSHVVLAAMAAKVVGRPVKLALERPQMFGPVGAPAKNLPAHCARGQARWHAHCHAAQRL